MGLAEKRAAQAFQNEVFPGLKKKVEEVAKFPVNIEVKWDQLAVDGYADSYATFFEKVYFRPLITALASITADQMGADALKGSLKKIVLCNTNEFSDSRGTTYAEGVLQIDHKPSHNVDDISARETHITKILEKNL